MRFKKLSFFSLMIILIFSIISCSSTNNYMVKDSNEYNKVTRNFVGNWAVSDYQMDSENFLDTTYEKIEAEFEFTSRNAKFSYWVSETKLSEKLIDWKEKYPDIDISEYKIIITSSWKLDDDGEILYLDNQNPNIVIKGSGENFEGFYEWERAKFEAGKNVGKDGGLAGFVLNKVAKEATGTGDLFPKLPSQNNFNFSNENRYLHLYFLGNKHIKLSKN